jgi:hypothetical protein
VGSDVTEICPKDTSIKPMKNQIKYSKSIKEALELNTSKFLSDNSFYKGGSPWPEIVEMIPLYRHETLMNKEFLSISFVVRFSRERSTI